ncbi:hypothetical protein HID58_032929, partial [Brassica napus]
KRKRISTSFIQTENKNKTHRSQTIVTKMAVEKLNTTVDGVEILKPRTDNREYRKIVLKNSLQVLLISDPDTNKCAASMSVSIRSFSDPQGLEGLAHLPATVNVASSPHSGTVSRLNFRLFDSLLTILFSYSAKFDAFTEPVSPILVERF